MFLTSMVQTEGYRQNPLRQNPLVRQNPAHSKLPPFYCECRDRERQINSSQCILCALRRMHKSHDISILQFNEYTKHTFRGL